MSHFFSFGTQQDQLVFSDLLMIEIILMIIFTCSILTNNPIESNHKFNRYAIMTSLRGQNGTLRQIYSRLLRRNKRNVREGGFQSGGLRRKENLFSAEPGKVEPGMKMA